MKKIYTIFGLLTMLSAALQAQPTLTFTTFSTGYSRIIDIRNCKDSRLFVVQQAGKIIVCDSLGVQKPTPFLNLAGICTNPASQGDERGLLGMAFHPDYKNNGYFYVNYTGTPPGGTFSTVIARYQVSAADSNVADPASATILLTIAQPYSNHNGGCLAFGPDGYLYIGTGDGGSANDPGNRAQNLTQLLGKMLRIDVDNPQAPLAYGIPADNPYVGTSNRAEIWSYGLRNPWKWSFDRIYGDMWIGDVGQNAWEEIDYEALGTAGGRNYGWRCYEGNVTSGASQTGCPAFSTTTPPVAVYSHSGGGCSVTGGYMYRGGKHASFYGHYIYTDYCDYRIRLIKKNTNNTFTTFDLGTVAGTAIQEFTAFGEDYRGELYVAFTTSGTIKKIGASGCLPTAAIIAVEDTINLCLGESYPTLSAIYHPENTYQWFKDGAAISGATTANLNTLTDGSYTVQVTNPSSCSNVSTAVSIITNTLPAVSFSGLSTTICTIDAPLLLTGSPAGGTFSGTGINGNTFDPAVAGAGTFAINYTYVNSGGCDTTVAQSIEVTICSGIEAKTNVAALNLFPNPNDGNFTLQFNANFSATMAVHITDITGKNVYSENINSSRGNNLVNLNVSELQKGFYLLKLMDGKMEINKSFVVR